MHAASSVSQISRRIASRSPGGTRPDQNTAFHNSQSSRESLMECGSHFQQSQDHHFN